MELGRKDVERIVEEQVEAFEEALAERVDLEERRLATLLLALDRSNQDGLAISLAAYLATRHSARVVVTGGFADDLKHEAEQYMTEVEDRLRSGGVEVESLWAEGEESFGKILWAIDRTSPDLLILPSPYFRDLESLGEDSIGTNLDVLLSRSPIPLLVVRHPSLEASKVMRRILLAVFDDSPLSRAAAGWALLLAREARLDTIAIVEEEFVEMMEEVLEKEGITEEELGKRLSHELVPLVSAVLRRCSELDVSCSADYVTGDLVDTITSRMAHRQGLVVLRGYDREDRPRGKVARDVILRSRVPVLVVKGSDGRC
jgi:nucleotide-binding universal stress UspA family protein